MAERGEGGEGSMAERGGGGEGSMAERGEGGEGSMAERGEGGEGSMAERGEGGEGSMAERGEGGEGSMAERGEGGEGSMAERGKGGEGSMAERGEGGEGSMAERGEGGEGSMAERGEGGEGSMAERGEGGEGSMAERGEGGEGSMAERGEGGEGSMAERGKGGEGSMAERGEGGEGSMAERGEGGEGSMAERGEGGEGSMADRGKGGEGSMAERGEGGEGSMAERGEGGEGSMAGRGEGGEGSMAGRGEGGEGSMAGRGEGGEGSMAERGEGGEGSMAERALLQHSAVRSAIGGALNGAPFTVFAPTDESLVRLPAAIVAVLRNSSHMENLRQVMMYHFVRDKISRFAWEGPWRTVQGESVVLHLDDASFTVSDVPVLEYAAAISTSFVVHTTDGLLFPPSTRARLTGAEGRARGAAQLASVKESSAGGEGNGESGGDDYAEEYEEDYDEDVWRREALQQYDLFYLYAPAPAPAPATFTPSSDSSSLSAGAIAGIVIGCVAGVALIAALLYYLLVARHNKDMRSLFCCSHPPEDPEESAAMAAAGVAEGAAAPADADADAAAAPYAPLAAGAGGPMQCQQYPLAVLKQATGNWAEEQRIGSGGYADVYRAVDPADPSVVWAVKRAKVLTNDFKREIKEMASKHHPNLVRLLGYCLDMDTVNERMEQILIYQYMHNGDLEHWVGTDAAKQLTLAQRMDVLVGAAHGLEYLHSFGIVHRDIKLANILLDQHMHAKVADFGLVRMGEGTSVYTTRILGTPGYVDPAYSRTRKATTATDVFSFGIVILEVITGRRALVNTGSGNSTIKEWAEEGLQSNDLSRLRDAQLHPPLPDDILLRAVRLAISCTLMPTATRPTMSHVYSELSAIRQECFGVEENRAAHKVDDELRMVQAQASIPLEKQLEYIESFGSSKTESSSLGKMG
ncbi:unnamed protein product [Closterium sp. NIES-65]|nr:unnamed protein product [Closterium sp. NIES-65]